MTEQTVLITGASSGIGLELAKVFAQRGHPVVLLARSKDKLTAHAQEIDTRFKVRTEVLAADLNQPDAAVQIAEELQRRGITIDILVNNAGFGLLGPFADLGMQEQLNMIQTNITALAHLTRVFLPGMIQRNRGGVLNVASTAAFQAGPLMAVYYATKAFVLSFSEALHNEVAHTEVHVSCLCPGPTHTGFVAAAGMDGISLFKMGADSAQSVAVIGYEAYRRNQAIAIPGIKNKVGAFFAQMGPRSLARKIAMALNQ